jgi:UDP-N-acetylglucosamine:LPS N-acetylglucosamine transferase
VMETPFILVPLPDSHQEANARYFEEQVGVPLLDKRTTPEIFAKTVIGYLRDPKSWPGSIERLRRVMPPKAVSRFADMVLGRARR